jgi:hypothetical protein
VNIQLLAPAALPEVKKSPVSLNMRLDGPRVGLAMYGEEKNLFSLSG